MDENFIKGVFLSAAGETVNVKVIRDKNSGLVDDALPFLTPPRTSQRRLTEVQKRRLLLC